MQVLIYSIGIVHCSVCAPKEMARDVVEKEVNAINPSGVTPWKISEDKFADGSPNPQPCDKDEKKVHYLMVC